MRGELAMGNMHGRLGGSEEGWGGKRCWVDVECWTQAVGRGSGGRGCGGLISRAFDGGCK